MRYAIVIEKGQRNHSPYVPDLPGCVCVGDTLDEVKADSREAIAFHLEGMREDGLPVPEPSSRADTVEVGDDRSPTDERRAVRHRRARSAVALRARLRLASRADAR